MVGRVHYTGSGWKPLVSGGSGGLVRDDSPPACALDPADGGGVALGVAVSPAAGGGGAGRGVALLG